jgi:RNA polymerase sigma-70 factor, ECF subfamily
MSTLSDGELVALARDGNADAFEVLYDRHASAAYSLAHRMCGVRGMADDVVQEAFLSLWRRLDRYDAARGQLRSWLLGIVHNGAIDRLRQTGAHDRRRASTEGIEDRLEAAERTDLEVQRREEADRVRAALAQLPSEQRRVIELAYFDGLTHVQVAGLLELPVGTIKGRMRLGLAKLRTLLPPVSEAEATPGRAAV